MHIIKRFNKAQATAGKVTIVTVLAGIMVFAAFYVLNLDEHTVPKVEAQSNATTSVEVLNTPPDWTVDAEEGAESSITNPTNSGDAVSWVATGTDANGEDYYLLICNASSTPIANSNAAPECTGGTQWAVSTSTASGQPASVSTTTAEAWDESNDWYAYICDDNTSTPRCNAAHRQGSGSTASPFLVNHRPTFSLFSDSSPTLPGAVITWHSTSTDSDIEGGADTLILHVCKEADFTGTECGAGGFWASTTLTYTADTAASTTLPVPLQDDDYEAYGYVVDNHGHAATGGQQGADSVLTVANATPTVSSGTININGLADLELAIAGGETENFTLSFAVSDGNSCVANASTTYEVATVSADFYRSGVTAASCNSAGDYDPNNCYTGTVATTTWNLVCTQDNTSCGGPDDSTVTWSCTFPLWFLADATDAGSFYAAEDWRATVTATDDNSSASTPTESAGGQDVLQLMSFVLNTSDIPYGALEPGQTTEDLIATTTIAANGNVGLDQNLYGEHMCPGYSGQGTCPFQSPATSSIHADNQKFGTTTTGYVDNDAYALATTTQELELNLAKTISTSTLSEADIYWGIGIPGTITFAGEYFGENTFQMVTSESAEW
ncbi:MAG: hypothetical protein WDZ88_02955 [Candidatus Paceibacterota bacterium]